MKKFAALIPFESLAASTWKHGTTREIAIHPKGATLAAQDFAWRLSTAEVNGEGAFSIFPDFERLLTLTKGSELLLEFSDLRKTLKPGQVMRFEGAREVTALLPAGPVSDLGLIYDPDQALAKLSVLELRARPRSFVLTAPNVFVHLVSGDLSATVFPGGEEFSMRPGDTLLVQEHEAERILFLDPGESNCRVVAVEIAEVKVARN